MSPTVSDSPLVTQRLARGDILPRWWGIGWDEERIALRVQVHRFFLEHDRHASIPPYGEATVSLLDSLGFGISDFCGDLRDLVGFGINRAFVPVETPDPHFAEFLVPYPQVDSVVGACDRCDEYDGIEHCLACQGTGERREIDWKAAHAVSVSLHLFFHMVQFPDSLMAGDEPQLMEIEVSAGNDRAAISGEFSLPFRSWLSSRLLQSRLDEPERAMVQAHTRLFGLPPMDPSRAEFQFRAGIDCDPGWAQYELPWIFRGRQHPPEPFVVPQPGIRIPEPWHGYAHADAHAACGACRPARQSRARVAGYDARYGSEACLVGVFLVSNLFLCQAVALPPGRIISP